MPHSSGCNSDQRMNALNAILASARQVVQNIRRRRRIAAQKRALAESERWSTRRIVIGSSGTAQAGWVQTDREVIDLLSEETWLVYFVPGSLDGILAEHVWEHLSANDATRAAEICFKFLKPGGYLRVAVPDGLNPNSSYIDQVRPGGTGPGADDHKVLYVYSTFRDLFIAAGFEVRLYEYYDDMGRFHFNDWGPLDGMIRRSMRYEKQILP